ncbi:MAG: SDR family oxidoreductase [Akkermansiaceae bacterium]|nr:SDR family oxidoreductase [Armatimonadota bacterium]
MATKDLDGKIALITGANKGIGFETARQLGQRGATVLIGARDAGRGETAAQTLCSEGLNAEVVVLDTSDPASVQAAAQAVGNKYGRLDILINNAGVIIEDWMTPPSQTTLETFQNTFATNVWGVIATTQAFLPLVKNSPAGRIVNVSSTMGSLTAMSDPANQYGGGGAYASAYRTSKAALNMLTELFAKELAQTPIKINSICPGWVRTEMGSDAAPRSVEQGATASVRYATLPADGPTGGFFDEDGVVAW